MYGSSSLPFVRTFGNFPACFSQYACDTWYDIQYGQMLISRFWPDWDCYARLGVFHTIFSTKVAFLFFPQKLTLILNYHILNICRVLHYTICTPT